jgi:hypothetical protein
MFLSEVLIHVIFIREKMQKNNEYTSIKKISTKLPMISGILLIICSATILYRSLLIIFLLLKDMDVELHGMETTILFFSYDIIALIFGIFALLGGYYFHQEKVLGFGDYW